MSDGILDAIGDTPLVALHRYLERSDLQLWGKLEAVNPGGSAKDRPAARMLADAWADGRLRPGSTVIESSSGNMGVGLAQACGRYGVALICVTDSRASPATIATMRALGADVRIVTEPDPATGDLLAARLALVASLLADVPDAFWTDQYANPSNAAAHQDGTMAEILDDLDDDLDYVFVATSTTGTLRGCTDVLRARGLRTQVVAVDAAGSALFGGVRGPRLLPGFGAGVETALSAGASFEHLARVSDLDCVVGCRRLAAREAILAGASGGGAMAAMDRLAPTMAPGSRCAVILADGGTRYLDTVYDDAWVQERLGCDPAELHRRVHGVRTPAGS